MEGQSDVQIVVDETVEIEVKHGTVVHNVTISKKHTVLDMKRKLEEITNVLSKRQKLLGPINSSDDNMLLGSALKATDVKKIKIMLMGTPEKDIFIDAENIPDLPEVINDFDFVYTQDNSQDLLGQEIYKQKLRRRVNNIKLNIINPPRKGKKLLVLDIDYTIFDCKSAAESIEILKRPHLDAFLEAVYPDYDIVFWSQTSWKWIEMKLTEMQILLSSKFQVTFIIDKTAMFEVESQDKRRKDKRTHHVKPLEFIWSKFPEYYNKSNTVHVDDLRCNFAMNPSNGLHIKAFKNAPTTRHGDSELLLLIRYLKHIAAMDDLSAVQHDEWKDVLKKL